MERPLHLAGRAPSTADAGSPSSVTPSASSVRGLNPTALSFEPSGRAVDTSASSTSPSSVQVEALQTPNSNPLQVQDDPLSTTPTEASAAAEALSSTPKAAAAEVALPLSGSSNATSANIADLVLSVCSACVQGNSANLSARIHPDPCPPNYPSSFELVNTAHPHTGLFPLHYAASRGFLHISQYLLEQGAMILEDPSGETPLHVAAYKGHAAVLKELIQHSAQTGDGAQHINAADADGWTPLHNACSKGWLDIVQMLIAAGANPDQASNLGYTPLMNAASKGHLPILNLLLTKGLVDPFKRNRNGEAAYDTASASEPYVCEVLANHEAHLWEQKQAHNTEKMPYNPLAFHVNYVAMLHENQRLDLRLTSLGHRANFTASAISKSDARSPFTLPSSFAGVNATRLHLPVYRSDLGLPTITHPFQLVLPPVAHAHVEQHDRERDRRAPRAFRSLSGSSFRTTTTVASDSSYFATPPQASSSQHQLLQQAVTRNSERSHFWITDWFIDLSSPTVDPMEGWEYATSFDAPPDQWTNEPPTELRRLMEQPGLGMSGSTKWVRRRRWVRVMRRRLDRPSLPFADLDGPLAISQTGNAALLSSSASNDASSSSHHQQQQPAAEADYVARARYTAGVGHRLGARAEPSEQSSGEGGSLRSGKTATTRSQGDVAAGKAEARRLILRLESAITELRQGLLSDEDLDRIQQAQALLETYVRRLEEIKAEAGQELMAEDPEEDEDEENFVYRPSSNAEHLEEESTTPTMGAGAVVSSPSISINRAPSLDRDLSQATGFRVPTREAPVMRTNSSSHSVPVAVSVGPTWQPDEEATHCCRCNATFTLFRRKHHCRRCGKVVCASCSKYSDKLDPCDVVLDPNGLQSVAALQQQQQLYRTCSPCHAEIADRLSSPDAHPGGLPLNSDLLSTIVPPLHTPGSPLSSSVSSQTSVLQECPVCGFQLSTLGNQADQEEHIRRCLEEGNSIAHSQRYLVFKLGQSPLVGSDCVICFEELALNDEVARLPCLCFYHRRCISAWMARDRGCPVHARD